ncbi:MAG TPA: RlmE family RNA methyltransferase [Myxococcales bacterium]
MPKPYDPKDFYYRKAKKEGLRARSAYKIDEIADRFRLLKPGMAILDLGAAPGGWLQVMAEKVGEKGLVIGVDLVAIAPIAKRFVKTAVLDILAPDFEARLAELHPGKFDLVTSDMAPKTMGIKDVDETRSLELSELALATAKKTLKPGGNFVCKVFMGSGFDGFLKEVKKAFVRTKVMRPEATRDRSYEHYVVGLELRQAAAPAKPDHK